jgi:hypothetical protein
VNSRTCGNAQCHSSTSYLGTRWGQWSTTRFTPWQRAPRYQLNGYPDGSQFGGGINLLSVPGLEVRFFECSPRRQVTVLTELTRLCPLHNRQERLFVVLYERCDPSCRVGLFIREPLRACERGASSSCSENDRAGCYTRVYSRYLLRISDGTSRVSSVPSGRWRYSGRSYELGITYHLSTIVGGFVRGVAQRLLLACRRRRRGLCRQKGRRFTVHT